MCLVLYIGSDMDFPLVKPQDLTLIDHNDASWPSKVIQFSVENLTEENKTVTRHFSTGHIRYAGSFEGCGCGFNASFTHEWDEPPEEDYHYLAGRESRRLLREYVETHRIRQIYACWSGDESLAPESTLDIMAEQITNPNFEIPERVMLRISKS
jgi:hypothetical protein